MLREINALFIALNRSTLRTHFHLNAIEHRDLETKPLPVILEHERQFIIERLASIGAIE